MFTTSGGDCSGASTCVVTMDASKVITATFTLQGGGCVGPAPVAVTNFTFTPKALTAQQGDCVRWNFNQGTHSVTESKRLGPGTSLFDSGPMPAGSNFTYTFAAAGKYAYKSTAPGDPKGMNATVQIPVTSSANSGGLSTPITITWSNAALAGFRFDVQYRHKSGGKYSGWTDWRSNQTVVSDAFIASSLKGKGTYQFRARLENASSSKTTGWSPSKTIVIS